MTNSPKLQSTSSNNEDYIVGGKTMGGKTNSGEVAMIFRAGEYRAIPRSKPPKHVGQDFLNCENCHFSTKTLWTGVSSGKSASYRALLLMETNTDKNLILKTFSLNFVCE